MFKDFNVQMVNDMLSTDSSVHSEFLKDREFEPITQVNTFISKIAPLGFVLGLQLNVKKKLCRN